MLLNYPPQQPTILLTRANRGQIELQLGQSVTFWSAAEVDALVASGRGQILARRPFYHFDTVSRVRIDLDPAILQPNVIIAWFDGLHVHELPAMANR